MVEFGCPWWCDRGSCSEIEGEAALLYRWPPVGEKRIQRRANSRIGTWNELLAALSLTGPGPDCSRSLFQSPKWRVATAPGPALHRG